MSRPQLGPYQKEKVEVWRCLALVAPAMQPYPPDLLAKTLYWDPLAKRLLIFNVPQTPMWGGANVKLDSPLPDAGGGMSQLDICWGLIFYALAIPCTI